MINPLKKIKGSTERILFVPDCHIPYHDKKAWKLLLKVCQAFKPDTIAVIGDFADCYIVSDHQKDPSRESLWVEEKKQVIQCKEQLEHTGAKRLILTAGNHEDRYDRYLKNKAPALFEHDKIKKELEFDRGGWEYVPYKDYTTIGKMNVTHDVGHSGKYAAFQTLDAFQDNVVFGHTHRLCAVYSGNVKGHPHVCLNIGWLGDVSKIDYMHQAKAKKDWQLGFGIGYKEPGGIVHAFPIPIIFYKCIIDGKLISV